MSVRPGAISEISIRLRDKWFSKIRTYNYTCSLSFESWLYSLFKVGGIPMFVNSCGEIGIMSFLSRVILEKKKYKMLDIIVTFLISTYLFNI